MICQLCECSNISNEKGADVSNNTNFAPDWINSCRMSFPHNALVKTAESFRIDVSRSKAWRKLKTGLSKVHRDHEMRPNPSCDVSVLVSIWKGILSKFQFKYETSAIPGME